MMNTEDTCEATCEGAPFDCTCCKRYCEPYGWDEDKKEWIYKDLYRPKEGEELND